MGWGGLQLDIPATVDPAVADLIRRCWSEPALRPSFSELISVIKDMAHARGLHPAVWPADPGPDPNSTPDSSPNLTPDIGK